MYVTPKRYPLQERAGASAYHTEINVRYTQKAPFTRKGRSQGIPYRNKYMLHPHARHPLQERAGAKAYHTELNVRYTQGHPYKKGEGPRRTIQKRK